jgi:hypothetical protein
MPFHSKTNDWRKLPQENREAMLAAFQSRAQASALQSLSRLGLAQACGINPDPWQKDLLESEEQQLILNCSRQSGKSTISALIALHEACYKADSLSLVLAPSQRQSLETYRKVRDYYNMLSGVPDVAQESTLKLELANNARVMVLPGRESNVRGFSGVSLLIVDEAARVGDELYNAIRPMLAVSQGRIILLFDAVRYARFFLERMVRRWTRLEESQSNCRSVSTHT